MERDGGSSPQVRRGTASISRRSYRQPLRCLLGWRARRAKFILSTVVKTNINSNIPIVITGPFFIQSKDMDDYKRSQDVGKQSLKFRNVAKFGENEKKEG